MKANKKYQKRTVLGNILTVKQGDKLPAKCIKCNSDAKIGLKQKLTWIPTWMYIFGPIRFYPIINKFVMRRGFVTFGLCPKHYKIFNFLQFISWSIVLLGIILITMHFVPNISALMNYQLFIGIIILYLGIIFGLYIATPIKAIYIDKTKLKIKGCCKKYLNFIQKLDK